MHKPESVLRNETHKVLSDFKIKTDYLIPSRRPDTALISKEKRTCHQVDFAVLVEYRVKMKANEKISEIFGQRIKSVKHHGDMIAIVIGTLRTVYNCLKKRLGELKILGRKDTIQTAVL